MRFKLSNATNDFAREMNTDAQLITSQRHVHRAHSISCDVYGAARLWRLPQLISSCVEFVRMLVAEANDLGVDGVRSC